MRLSDLMRSIFHHDVPPSPPSERPQPTRAEIRFAQAERDALIRDARALDVDVDFQRTVRS